MERPILKHLPPFYTVFLECYIKINKNGINSKVSGTIFEATEPYETMIFIYYKTEENIKVSWEWCKDAKV